MSYSFPRNHGGAQDIIGNHTEYTLTLRDVSRIDEKMDLGWCCWHPRPVLLMADAPYKPPDASIHPPNLVNDHKKTPDLPWRGRGHHYVPKPGCSLFFPRQKGTTLFLSIHNTAKKKQCGRETGNTTSTFISLMDHFITQYNLLKKQLRDPNIFLPIYLILSFCRYPVFEKKAIG